MKTNDETTTTVEMTPRTCSLCGRRYAWPKGSRRPGATCPTCQPNLELGGDA